MSVQENNLKAIADAIREKEGSTGAIPANTFAERIKALPSGGLPEDVYTISVEASDPEGGSVSGGGVASKGMTITVSAQENNRYAFGGWTENGDIVSDKKEYPFAVAQNRNLKAVFSKSRLPAGYTEVEYLQTPGSSNSYYSAWIVVPALSTATKWQMGFSISDSIADNDTIYLYGNANGNNTFGLVNSRDYPYTEPRQISYRFGIYNSGSARKNIGDWVPGQKQVVTIDFDEKYLQVDDTKVEDFNPGTYLRNSCWFGGMSGQGVCGKKMNLYFLKIFDTDGSLLLDYVPCVDPSGVVGMYDLVSGSFIAGSSGNGGYKLTPGPAV